VFNKYIKKLRKSEDVRKEWERGRRGEGENGREGEGEKNFRNR
jgi:hypothetical protein